MAGHVHIEPYRGGFGVEHGSANGCPFCLARKDRYPAQGKSIMFLSGSDVGQVGVITENSDWARASGKFIVKMNYAPETHTRVVDPSLELFIDPEAMTVPDWMPALSIEDACALHEQVLQSLQFPPQGSARKAAAKIVTSVVARCWGQRLPLDGAEVWAVLAAHGARDELKTASIELFDFGLALLVGAQGRVPIRRRRMSALSRGRYLTKKGRELWVRLFGHD
jgi:hypothetical protein